jgi:hypothetical protein
VKKSGRDEPNWVVIHLFMETIQVISLYNCLYLKLAKTLFFLIFFIFSLLHNRRTREWNRFCSEAGAGGEVAQIK